MTSRFNESVNPKTRRQETRRDAKERVLGYFEEISDGVAPVFVNFLVEQVTSDLMMEVKERYNVSLTENRVLSYLLYSKRFLYMAMARLFLLEYGENSVAPHSPPDTITDEVRCILAPLERAMRESDGQDTVHSGFVYLLEWKGLFKIGTSSDPEGRLNAINRNIPPGVPPVGLLFAYRVENPAEVERRMHDTFANKRAVADTGGREWFSLDQEDIAYIEAELSFLALRPHFGDRQSSD